MFVNFKELDCKYCCYFIAQETFEGYTDSNAANVTGQLHAMENSFHRQSMGCDQYYLRTFIILIGI